MTNGWAVSVSVAEDSEAVRAPSATRIAFKLVPTLAIPVALWLFPFHLNLKAQHAIAITVFMILAWATELMDHGLTGLIAVIYSGRLVLCASMWHSVVSRMTRPGF